MAGGLAVSNLPKVTFGIVNCNRLYYLKSCLESLIFCTKSYENKELIVVDNASIEEGTSEYLDEIEKNGIIVVRQKKRDPSNEFAKALNIISEIATGEYICPLQGDMQFIVRGPWLEEYVRYFQKHGNNIGCISLDAQRKITIRRRSPYGVFDKDELDNHFRFFIEPKRPPISGAADVMYSKEIIKKIYPWNVNNSSHEGGDDSETAMLKKIEDLVRSSDLKDVFFISPQIPVSVAIQTDSRGTNARVRGTKRYGDYWPAKKDFRYYEIFEIEDLISSCDKNSPPLAIDDLAKGVEWNVPKDELGNWLKNPIQPESASINDYVDLEISNKPPEDSLSPDYLSEWLDDE